MATSGEEASVTDVSKTKAPGATEVSAAAEIAAAVASVVASAGVSTVASAVALRCTASTAGATHEAVRRGLRAAASRAAYCNNASGEAIPRREQRGERLGSAQQGKSGLLGDFGIDDACGPCGELLRRKARPDPAICSAAKAQFADILPGRGNGLKPWSGASARAIRRNVGRLTP